MRAAHTYRAARRNAMRCAQRLNTWGAYPLRVWMSGHRDVTLRMDGGVTKRRPWHVLVRTMPPLHKAST